MIEFLLQKLNEWWYVLATALYNMAVWLLDLNLTILVFLVDLYVGSMFIILDWTLDLGSGLLFWTLDGVNLDINAMVDSNGYSIFQQSCGFISHIINVPVIASVALTCAGIVGLIAIVKFCIKLIPTVG